MNIEVYVTGHAHDKMIDEFIYALLSGSFRNYQSMYSDCDIRSDGSSYPNLRVNVKENKELDPFNIALRIYQGISALIGSKDIEVRVNDAFIISANATFAPAPDA